MDEVDSPMIRPRHSRPSTNNFQSELSSKLADRRRKNLTTDITSDESDSENDDFLGELGLSNKSRNRPNSAKRRQAPDLGSTLKFPDRDSLFKSMNDKDSGRSKFLKKQTTLERSPEDKRRGLTAEDILNDKPSPRKEDKKSPFSSRKSPLLEDISSKRGTEWQPPSYQNKAPSPDFLNREPSDLSRGRLSRDSSKERDESSRRSQFERSPRLEPLESPTGKPSPRPRRTDSEETKKKRSTPTMDLFGSKRITLDDDDEEEKLPSPKPKRRESKDMDRQKSLELQRSGNKTPISGRKTPDGRKTSDDRRSSMDRKSSIDGRKTPTGRKTPVEGRKTPTDRRRLLADGRKTPTDESKFNGRKNLSDERRSKYDGRKSPTEERQPERRTPSLMELMAGGDPSVNDNKYRSSYRKEKSNDSFTEEMEGYNHRSDEIRPKRRSSVKRGKETEADASSVCEEYEVDPNPPSENLHKHPETKPRKSSKNQTSEHKESDDIIDNLADAQNTMQYIDPDKKTKAENKKVGLDQHKPKPRYSTPPGENKAPIVYDINDTKSMREAVFNQWKEERNKKAKQEIIEKKRKEKEEQEKKEHEKKEKKLEAMSSFNAWNEKKAEDLKKQQREKLKTAKKLAEKEQEKQEKMVDAIKSFEAWKETKDHVIKHQVTKKQREEQKKQRQEQNMKQERAKSASSAFRSWKDKKEVVIKKKVREEKRNQPDLYEEEKKKAAKEEAAREEYEIWLEEKEKRERKEREKKRHQSLSDENEFRPAWSPANRTIPFGR